MRGKRWLAALLCAAAVARAGPSRAKPISLQRGLPKPAGLGQLVIVSNLSGRDARYKAVKKLADARKAKILRFKESKVGTVRKALARIGPEFVAFALSPETVDINFHYEVLEMCRDLDADPMPDFHFGYLCARPGDDLNNMVERILGREKQPPAAPVAKIAALSGSGDQLKDLDFILHFGHGQAWRVDGGLTGEQVGRLDLPRAPVVWSGACFNGVLSRSYHKCAYQFIFLKPTTIDPEHLMTLNWVHAGATGYFAALEGDRGEMAMAEWDYFRARACTLGEVMTHQYRVAFTTLSPDFESFPRYLPGNRKNMSFFNVMLRGLVSRILLSDPAYRPLKEPLDPPAEAAEVTVDPESGTLTVRVEAKRFSQGLHRNYLSLKDKLFLHPKVCVRVALPDGVTVKRDEGEVAARNGPELEDVVRKYYCHEVWGGKRYLNLHADFGPGTRVKGLVVTYAFPVKK